MKSIQSKFIILILSCVLLSCTVVGGAGILNAQRVIDDDSAKIMNLLCSEKTGELNELFSCIEQSVKTVAVYTAEQLDGTDCLKDSDYLNSYIADLETVAVNAAANTEGALAVYVRFNPELAPPTAGLFWSKALNGSHFQKQTPTDFSRYSPSDDEHVGWYYIPVNNGRATWMAPYMNRNLGVQMISYVIPIIRDNKTVGIVGMDIDYGVVERVVKDTRVYENGYAFLADENGNIMYHREYALGTPMNTLDGSLFPVVSALRNKSSGSTLLSYEWKGSKKAMAFRTLSNGMRFSVTAPMSEINKARNSLTFQILVALLIISLIATALTIVFSRRLVRPLKELNEAAKKIAGGDLSVTITYQTADEVGTLAESFRKTVEHLQQYIQYINGLAYRDSLTGVKNKTAYLETERQMEERMRLGRPEFALVVLDINSLKWVNDNCGHDFGDLLIITASRLICKTFQHSPVYRIGGDEFVVFLEKEDLAHAAELLKKLEQEIREYNSTAQPDGRLSIARGLAIYDEKNDLVFANVFKRADDAMYKNKAAMKSAEGKKTDGVQDAGGKLLQ